MMNPAKTTAATIATTIAATIGIVFLLFPEARTDTDSAPAPHSSGNDSSASVAGTAASRHVVHAPDAGRANDGRLLRFRAPAGSRTRYSIRSSRSFTLSMSKDTNQTFRLSLEGTLERTSYASAEEGVLVLGYRFQGVRLQSDRAVGGEAEKKIASELEQETLIRMTDRGEVLSYHFPGSVGSFGRHRIKFVLQTMQVVLPPEEQVEWTTRERDMTGTYDARYRLRFKDDDSVDITKKTERYETLRAATPGDAAESPQLTPSGATRVAFDARHGRVESVRSERRHRIQGGGLRKSVAIASLQARRIDGEHDAEVAGRDARTTTARLARMQTSSQGELDGADQLAVSWRRTRLERLAAGHSVHGLVQHIVLLIKAGREHSREICEAAERLAAVIELDDRAARTAASLIENRVLPGSAPDFVASALGNAGTEAAQALLAGLIQQPTLTTGLRASCLVSLAAPQRPSVAAETAVRQLAAGSGEIAPNALLILGHMAHQLSGTGRAAAICRFIRENEARLRSRGETVVFLESLGNAGSPRAYPAIARYLKHSNDHVRATAVGALRRVDHRDVDSRLVVALGDRSRDVRVAALQVVETRGVSARLVPALRRLASRDRGSELGRIAAALLRRSS